MGGGGFFVRSCTSLRASGNTSTHAAAAGGGRAAAGGSERRAASPRSGELKRLRAELAEVTTERDDYRDTVDALLKDCERYLKRIKELEAKLSPQMRDRILAALGVGKPSPLYKRVKALLDQIVL